MKFTVRPVLRQDKKNKDGLCPVAICVTINRERVYSNIGVSVLPEQWDNEAKKIKRGFPNYDMHNATIGKAVSELEREMLTMNGTGQVVTLKLAKNLLNKDGDTESFLRYAQRVLDDMGKMGNKNTARAYKPKFDQLKEFAEYRLTFADITPAFLNKLYKHLIVTKKQDHNTTINTFKFIRKVFNQAKEEGITTYYPFTQWQYPKYQEKPKRYLVLSQLDALEKVLYEKPLDTSFKTVLAFFLVECYAGLRHSDWGKFQVQKIIKSSSITVTTTKTKETISIPLDDYPRLKRVIEYIAENKLTYNYTLEFTNRTLKAIAGITEPAIDIPLTTHVGRHTAATLLLEAGLSPESIAIILGISVRIVSTYAKITAHKIKVDLQKMRNI